MSEVMNMRPRAIGKILFPCLAAMAAVLAGGCSSVVNSHRQKAAMMTDYESGNNAAVAAEIDHKLSPPQWYNSSVVDTGDEAMWRLEAGLMNFHLGNFKESVGQFAAAERLIREYDDRAKISVRDVGAEAGTTVTNLNTLPYRGFCRDRIALSIYKALAYLGAEDEPAFRAQLHRLRNMQKKVLDDYREFFEKEKERIAEEKKKNPEAAKKADEEAANTAQSNTRNAEFQAGLKEVREIAHRGYGNFLNPAAIFLSGLGSVRDENYENARIDFRRLNAAMPNNPLLRQYYVTVLRAAGRPIPERLKDAKPFDFPLDRDCVFVIFANGKGPAFKQIAVYFPVMTAWPMCEFYPAPFEKMQAVADGEKHTTVILADMDAIIAQEFHERLPWIITRIVLSTAIKDGAYYGGLIAIWKSNMNPAAKVFTWLSVAIGGAGYRVAMNTADTRSWELLPKEFQLTQFPMPKNREVSLELIGNGNVGKTVRIPDDCRSAIIFVSAPSERNIVCHVLPIKSK